MFTVYNFGTSQPYHYFSLWATGLSAFLYFSLYCNSLLNYNHTKRNKSERIIIGVTKAYYTFFKPMHIHIAYKSAGLNWIQIYYHKLYFMLRSSFLSIFCVIFFSLLVPSTHKPHTNIRTYDCIGIIFTHHKLVGKVAYHYPYHHKACHCSV